MDIDHKLDSLQALDLADLVNKIRQWAIDRDIIGPTQQGTLMGQSLKLIEESMEVREAVFCLAGAEAMAKLVAPLTEKPNLLDIDQTETNSAIQQELDEIKSQVIDGIGDTTVVCIILCEMMDINIIDALAQAYNEIKDRKGKMVNGTFEKLYNQTN